MNDILLAAIGGGVGGALGGLIGAGIDKLRKKPSRIPLFVGLAFALAGARLAPLANPPPTIESRLDAAGPTFQAIHKYYPAAFAQIAAALKNDDASDPIALQNKARPLLAGLVGAHRREMDDATARALGQLMLDETQVLMTKSPESCVGILTGGATTVDLGKAMPPELIKRDAEVTGRLIEQVATHPAAPGAPVTNAEAGALATAALGQLSPADQKLAAPLISQQKPATTPEQARAVCGFYRAFFSSAMAAPAGTLRRVLTG